MILVLRLLLVLTLVLAAPRAEAGKVALVIGNTAYVHANPLPNAARDAEGMAARLTELGFAVYSGIDLSQGETLALLDEFSRALQPHDLALFFYAGHGAQVGTENYLIPVEAGPTDELSLTEASVKLQTILRTMELRADRRIVFLDACRNNPFVEKMASRSIGGVARGLARVEAGVGSFIAFSTQPGNVALDGSGQNSPFTAALLRHIGQPDADIHAVMRKVRAEVALETRETQVPWENSSLVDEVFLAAAPAAATGTAPLSIAKINRPTAGISMPAPEPAPEPAPPSTITVERSVVAGLDPGGDGFLALRSGPSSSARLLAKMPEGTILEILGNSGAWRQVALEDGRSGWAHSKWIRCCVAVDIAVAAPAPAPAPAAPLAEAQSCEALWTARNLIWKSYGYCFTTDRAIRSIGNDGCTRGLDRAAIALTDEDEAEVNRLAALEAQMGCN